MTTVCLSSMSELCCRVLLFRLGKSLPHAEVCGDWVAAKVQHCIIMGEIISKSCRRDASTIFMTFVRVGRGVG